MKNWDAELYRQHAGFISELGLPLVDLLRPQAGERILDIGCGDGVLTEVLARRGCEVVAIDSSPEMVDAARERGLDARVLSAVDLESFAELHERFDAVFSNAALHWIQPSGRFVAEFGGKGNVERIRNALHESLRPRGVTPEEVDPWYFPSPNEYTGLLKQSGFKVSSVEHFQRPTTLPGSIVEWLESLVRPFLEPIPAAEQGGLLKEINTKLEPVLRGEDGIWRADYVRRRVVAAKPYS